MMKRVLVTGCGGPASINFQKSLRISPERIFLVGTDTKEHYLPLSLADKNFLVPKAEVSSYIDELNKIVREEKIQFVHPQPDVEVLTIGRNRNKLDADTFLPSQRTIEICQNKLESNKIMRKKGIPIPKTIELKRESDVKKAFEELGGLIWIRAKHGAGGRGSTPASNVETALSWIDYWRSRNENWEFIAQEYLGGRNIGFHSLWKNGELLTSMARERLEYIYPQLAPSGVTGTPGIQRTIHDDNVNKVGTQAVLAIDPKFNGIACVDLKENSEGLPCVTEINAGRMFTTSFFFSYASKKICDNYFANIPYLYVKVAYKEKLPDIPKYNVLPEGIYWIRHIDASAKLVYAGKVLGAMYT